MEQQHTGRKAFHCLENKPPLLAHLLFPFFRLFTLSLMYYSCNKYSSGTYCVPGAGLALLVGIWQHHFCTPTDKPSFLDCPGGSMATLGPGVFGWGQRWQTDPHLLT